MRDLFNLFFNKLFLIKNIILQSYLVVLFCRLYYCSIFKAHQFKYNLFVKSYNFTGVRDVGDFLVKCPSIDYTIFNHNMSFVTLYYLISLIS